MAGAIDSEIAAWLSAYPAPDVDYRDVSAVRALTARYMSERGGAAPRWPREDVRMEPTTIAGVEALMWRPRDVADSLPVVIAFHGGAFIVGAPLGAERIAVPLAAEHGVCTVSIAYPLAPEHPAPQALDAAREVLAGLARVPGVDPHRVAVHGSSAGACLAAGLALHARDIGTPVALQSLSCPALDSRAPATADPGHSMRGSSPASPELRYAVPALADDLARVAPAHITLAEHDVLRDEGRDYAERLRQAGVDVTVDLVPGAVHGFDGLLPDSRIARAAIHRQVASLAEALHS